MKIQTKDTNIFSFLINYYYYFLLEHEFAIDNALYILYVSKWLVSKISYFKQLS